MISEIEIKMWGKIVGYAAYNNSQTLSFEYDDKFPLLYDLSPIMMPRTLNQSWSFDLNPDTYHGLPGLLADSLPDKYGNQMIDAWFSSQGISLSQISTLDRLCYLGTRAMGALEFSPNQNNTQSNSKLEIKTLVDLSQKILNERVNFKSSTDDLNNIIQIGSSAGGARAKAIIAMNPKTGEIHSGQINHEDFEHWIIKLDGVGEDNLGKPMGYTNIEYAYYLLAKDCGIEISESRLLEENGRSHFITKRFDREDSGEKLHMQTLCALAHLDYNQARVHSYETLFRITNPLKLSYKEREELFRRMVFNVVGRNHDDHSKNFSFLMNKDAKWSLAPAYDLNFAYNPENFWLKEHNLLVNGKSKDITREDLMIYAKNFHIKNAKEIINHNIEVFSQFKAYAKKAKVQNKEIKWIESNLLLGL